ncbi:MAG: hypothetical protein IPI03_04635 [Rubrivivax sp.]|nr:hypothetical protein [Rubrivivax sp.]MBK7261200.1 hypothetical protein [Rubrivivax sp.]MBK8529732.1 hypothetical protein [Rubrivivax sp.]
MRTFATTVCAVALLGGCAMHPHHPDGPRGPYRGEAQHQQVRVTVKGGIISVSPEPLVFLRSEREQRIQWLLPRGLSFADNGITIEGQLLDPATKRPLRPVPDATKTERALVDRSQQELVDCRPEADGQRYSCLNRNSRPGVYRYTIRVRADGKLLVWDPAIMNME